MLNLPLALVIPHPHTRRRAYLVDKPAWVGYILLSLFALTLVRNLRFRLPGVLGFASNITASDVVNLTNSARSQHGLATLRVSDSLSRAAQRKAEHMFAQNYWAHIAPDGTDPWFFIKNEGYTYLYAGENLARDFNDSGSVVDAWLASPSHRDNVLSSKYSEIGVAVVNGVLDGFETTLVVQMFGQPIQLASVPAHSSAQVEGVVTSTPVPTPVPAYPAPAHGPVLESPRKVVMNKEVDLSPRKAVNGLAWQAGAGYNRFFDFSNVTRLVSIVFVSFAGLLFFLDGLVARRLGIRRLSGHTLAHVGLLLTVLVALLYTSSGMVL